MHVPRLAYVGKGWRNFDALVEGVFGWEVLINSCYHTCSGEVGVWYLSVIFLTLYFGVLILRMVIFTMFWVIGFDFWIFPNLNDEPLAEEEYKPFSHLLCFRLLMTSMIINDHFAMRYCGFLDSFQPLYSWEKRKDDALMLLVRFVSLGIAAVAIQQIAENTSFEDVQDTCGKFNQVSSLTFADTHIADVHWQDLVKSSYADVLAWGVDKLTALCQPQAAMQLACLKPHEDNLITA